MERDVEIQVAVASAVQPLAALPGKAQALTVGRSLGDAHLERARYAPDAPLVVEFRNRQVELHLRAAIGVLEGDVGRDFIVLAWHAYRPRATPAAPAAQPGEKVSEIEVLEREARIGDTECPSLAAA